MLDGDVGIGIDDPAYDLHVKGTIGLEVPDESGRFGMLNARRLKFGWRVDEGDETIEKQCGFFHETENQISVGFWDDDLSQLKSSFEFYPGGILISKWEDNTISNHTPKMNITGESITFDNGFEPEEESSIASYGRNSIYFNMNGNVTNINPDGSSDNYSKKESNQVGVDFWVYKQSFDIPIEDADGNLTGFLTSTIRKGYQEGGTTLFSDNADEIFIETTQVAEEEVSLDYYIKGRLFVTNIKVRDFEDTSFWPDFVFKKDYKLRSLDELSNFVTTNNHLPDVPTQQDIEENGIDLVENQAVLLKKIEELTLYIIELEKKNNEQNQVLEQVKSQLERLEEKAN